MTTPLLYTATQRHLRRLLTQGKTIKEIRRLLTLTRWQVMKFAIENKIELKMGRPRKAGKPCQPKSKS